MFFSFAQKEKPRNVYFAGEKHLFPHATHKTLQRRHRFFQRDQGRFGLDGRERVSFQVIVVHKTKAVRNSRPLSFSEP